MARTKGAKEVAAERKSAMLDLTDVGVQQNVIVQHFSLLQSIVANIIRRRNESNNAISERRERKLNLTPRCICSPVKSNRENRFKPLRVRTSKFNEFSAVSVSLLTVGRVLKQRGIDNYMAVCKPLLTRNHEKIRMNWAKHHQSWGKNK